MKRLLQGVRIPKMSPTASMLLFIISIAALGWAQWQVYEPVIFTFGACVLGTMFVLLTSTLKSYQTNAIIPGIIQAGFFFLTGYFTWMMLDNFPMSMQAPARIGLFTAMIAGVNLILTLSGNNSLTNDGIFEEDYFGRRKGQKERQKQEYVFEEKRSPFN